MPDGPRRPRRPDEEDPYDLPPDDAPRRRDRRVDEGAPRRGGRYDDEDDRPRRSWRRRDDDEYDRPRPKREPSMQQMDLWIKLGLAGGLVFVVLLGVGIWFVWKTVARSPFRAQMAQYMAPPTGMGNPATSVKKLVVVDVAAQDLDSLHYELPDDLRASSPAEATTVVWLKWNKAQVGTYTTGGAAYQWHCLVTVIDLGTRTKIREQNFTGSPPPQSIRSRRGTSHSGDKPNSQIVNFLRGLPRS
jgi:hypothetical protein